MPKNIPTDEKFICHRSKCPEHVGLQCYQSYSFQSSLAFAYSPGPDSENYLDLIYVAHLCEKVIIVPDTNHITSAIRNFILDMPNPGSFQNIGLLISAQQSSELVKPCGSNWVNMKGAQLKINLYSPIIHWMLIKNGKRTMMIRCILTELLECKVHENGHVSS